EMLLDMAAERWTTPTRETRAGDPGSTTPGREARAGDPGSTTPAREARAEDPGWKVERSALTAHDGAVTNSRNGESFSYSELTRGQKLVKVLKGDAALIPAAQWKIAGTATPKVDGKAFVTGAHQYTSDMSRAGMLYGKVLRPKAFNAKLASFDAKE